MNRFALLCLALLMLGCSRDDSDTPARPFSADGVSFSLTPSAARDCDPATRYEGEIRWQVPADGRVRLEVRIGSADGQLFARSDEAQGSARTGPWVQRGMWFLLIDRGSGRVLAAQRAGPDSCP